MSYSHTTRAQLRTALLDRLGDPSGVYWTTTECNLYIDEALRTWGLVTGYWRDSGLISTIPTPVTGYFDISGLQNTALESLLSYSVTDTTLASLIQYHLLEPAPGINWTGSEQFTYNDLLGALQRRRDNFLVESNGAVVTAFNQVLPAASQTVDLPESTLVIKNLHWQGSLSGADWPLIPDDIGGQRNYSNNYLTTQGVPQTYSSSSVKPLRYVIAPPSNEPGTLRVLAIQSGATLTGAGVAMGVPDNMSWVVKWGALADILGKEGPGQDLSRSYFCERRWKLGVALAQANPVVINAEINGVALSTEAIEHVDQYMPNWYSAGGTPTFIMSLRNLVTLAPFPSANYSVKLDVVRNAIVPTNDADFIQVAKDVLDVILDYVEHLAAFKSGGYEFMHTFRGAENFFNAALAYNQRLTAKNPGLESLIRQSTEDDAVRPPKNPTNNSPLQSAAASSGGNQ